MTEDGYTFSFDDYLSKDLGIDTEQLETLDLNYGNEGRNAGASSDKSALYGDDAYGLTGIDTANEGSDARLYRTDGSSGLGNISDGHHIAQPSLMESITRGASSWIKDNKELATMIGSGIAGAVRDKNQREMSQAQIDYYKQRQADLNASITPYDLGAALKRRGKA